MYRNYLTLKFNKIMEVHDKSFVVEKSTHPHVLESEKAIEIEKIDDSTLDITLNGNSIVTHGQHGTLKIDTKRVIKYVQKEVNPVTRKIQNAFD